MAGRVGVQTAVSMDEIRSRMIRMIRIRLCGDWEQDVGNRLERGSEGAEARQKDDAWPRAEREVLVFFGCSCVSAWAQGQCGRWADGIVCLRDRHFRDMPLGMALASARVALAGCGRLDCFVQGVGTPYPWRSYYAPVRAAQRVCPSAHSPSGRHRAAQTFSPSPAPRRSKINAVATAALA